MSIVTYTGINLSTLGIDDPVYAIFFFLYSNFLFIFSANTDGTPGAVGFLSRSFPKIYPIAIIKVDEVTGEPIRDSRGLCQVHSSKSSISI